MANMENSKNTIVKAFYICLAIGLLALFTIPSYVFAQGGFPSTNELNKRQGPYVEVFEKGLGYIELEFVNPGPGLVMFEYRIDGEDSPYAGTEWENSHPLVDQEGNWRYDDPDYDYEPPHFKNPGPGNYYPLIGLDPSGNFDDPRVEHSGSRVQRFNAGEKIEVRLAYAEELKWCFDWATFNPEQPVIEAVENEGGTISPSGSISVPYGGDKTFEIEPDPGYFIEEVVVDGESVGPVDSYSFFNINSNQTIEPFFSSLKGSDADFVTMLYNNILGREPDPQGLTDWVMAINEGKTGKDVAMGLIFSDEGQDITEAYDNTQFVAYLYNALLDRQPDEPGLIGWVAALYEGMSRASVVEGLCRSTEWENICTGYQIKPY